MGLGIVKHRFELKNPVFFFTLFPSATLRVGEFLTSSTDAQNTQEGCQQARQPVFPAGLQATSVGPLVTRVARWRGGPESAHSYSKTGSGEPSLQLPADSGAHFRGHIAMVGSELPRILSVPSRIRPTDTLRK